MKQPCHSCLQYLHTLRSLPDQVVDLLGQRKGQMMEMSAAVGEGTTQRVKYRIPTRGLLVRSAAWCCMMRCFQPCITLPDCQINGTVRKWVWCQQAAAASSTIGPELCAASA